MTRTLAALTLAMLALARTADAADRPLTFWNLTSGTITHLVMAPAGTSGFGADQCANDRDGSVDHDERLRLTGVQPGRYDVRLTQKGGRVCTIRSVEVKGQGRYAFSLGDDDLKECMPGQ